MLETHENQAQVDPGVIDAVLKESRKEKIPYRMEALQCLVAILESYKVDRFSEVAAIAYPDIEEVSTSSSPAYLKSSCESMVPW